MAKRHQFTGTQPFKPGKDNAQYPNFSFPNIDIPSLHANATTERLACLISAKHPALCHQKEGGQDFESTAASISQSFACKQSLY